MINDLPLVFLQATIIRSVLSDAGLETKLISEVLDEQGRKPHNLDLNENMEFKLPIALMATVT